MKKLILITGAILMVYLIVITAAAQPAKNTAPQAVTADVNTEHSGYMIGVSDGRVAVFHDGELYVRTDTQVSTLPKADRTRLENGIHLDSLKEIKELLQDYCS